MEGEVWLLIAQASQGTDPLSGGSGWVGAGLLGLVLAWLMFRHLPAKDDQIMQMVESRDELVKSLQENHERHMMTFGLMVEKQLKMVIDHCHTETSAMVAALQDGLEYVGNAVVEMRKSVDELRRQKP